MTREEAIKAISDMILDMEYPNGVYHEKFTEDESQKHLALYAVKKALRPVSREQVEKVWRGEWNYSHTTETDHFAVVKCSKCGHEAFAMAIHVKDGNFCPHCGAPMTDEAVEMVMERLGALNDAVD